MNKTFKKDLHNHKLLVGTIVSLESAAVTEILSQLGFDWLFLDSEHSTFNYSILEAHLRAAQNTPCLIRIPASNEMNVKKSLDIGAVGIIAPMINSAEDAESIVKWAKYSPVGSRGVGLARAQKYGAGFDDYISNANDSTVVVVQAENIKAVENIEKIVRVENIDSVFVGPYDLSASMGHIGEVTHPDVVSAIDHVTEVCKAAEMPLGIFGASSEAVKSYIRRGYSLVAAGVDVLFLSNSAKKLLADLGKD